MILDFIKRLKERKSEADSAIKAEQRSEEATPKLSDEEKASAAKALLDNPVFMQAFIDIELNITELWKRSSNNDIEVREQLWLSLKILHKIEGQFKDSITTHLIKERKAYPE
jgi:hypothetical protein